MSDVDTTNTNANIDPGAGENNNNPTPPAGDTNTNPQGDNNNPPAANNNQPGAAAPTTTGTGAQEGNNQPKIDYNFEGVQMPEGFTLSPEENARFIDVIKDMNLTNEQASAIVKYGGEYAERITDQVYKLHEQEITNWGEETKKALGADLQKTLGLCDTFIRKANIPGLREALNETGAGNKLAIVKAFAKAGEMCGEDPGKAAGVGVSAANGGGANDVIAAMFPNTDFSKYK